MPRHQDNVDVILTTPTRQRSHFVGAYSLEMVNPLDDSTAGWWGAATTTYATRFFETTQSIGEVLIYASMEAAPPGDLAVGIDEMWGPRRVMSGQPGTVSKFTWTSDKGHEITLSLAAGTRGGTVDVVCRDTDPPTAKWEFDLKVGGDVIGTYVVDYTTTEASIRTPNVATFTVHQTHSRTAQPQS